MKYCYQLLKGLNDIHRKFIIHRDIKPENVFLVKDGKKVTMKIGDFGLSQKVPENETYCHSFVGTPLYVAPEIIKLQPYTNKIDVWSLGCTLFELCILEPIFNGSCSLELNNCILNRPIPRIPNQYSDKLQNYISKMLVKDAHLRSTVAEILALYEEENVTPEIAKSPLVDLSPSMFLFLN